MEIENEDDKKMIELLNDVFSKVEQLIKDEMRTSGNDWLASFGSSLFVVTLFLKSSYGEKYFSSHALPGKYDEAIAKVDELQKRFNELSKAAESIEIGRPDISDEEKEELLTGIKSIGMLLFGVSY